MKDVIVVIGPGQIGQAIARRVAVGKHVLLADLRAENAEAAAQVLGDAGYEVSVATVDVSSREDVHALVDRATSLGDVTGLIHAAGVSPSQASPATILRVEKDAGRDGADDVAALVVAGEVTGQRCEQLARHGGQADEGQARQQDGVGGCQRAGHQCHDGARHDRRDEPASANRRVSRCDIPGWTMCSAGTLVIGLAPPRRRSDGADTCGTVPRIRFPDVAVSIVCLAGRRRERRRRRRTISSGCCSSD